MTFEDYELSLNLDLEQVDDRYILNISRNAWNAAIEAICTKLVRGTNLYNISGDHISGQVVESIEQLKSS